MKRFSVVPYRERQIADFVYRGRGDLWRAGNEHSAGAQGLAFYDVSGNKEADDYWKANIYWVDTQNDAIQLCAELAFHNPGVTYIWSESRGMATCAPGDVRMKTISEKGVIPQ